MDTSFASRHLNQGFSGGEKKRNEILQMALLEPLVAVLDETDSGLDIDALRVVGRGVRAVREARPELGVLAITHYQRLLDELVPDVVHLLVDGRIVASGGPELAAHGRGRGLRGAGDDAGAPTPGAAAPLNVEALRKDFPLLTRTVNGRPIVYLDAASSALQPRSVIDAMTHYYETTHANVHRGVYATAEEATALYERARVVAGRFIGAPDPAHEVVFTKNTTESLNLVAHSLGPGQPAGRRRDPPDRDGAPRQHRAVDDPLRGARRPRPPLHPDRRRRAPRARRPRPPGRRRQARRHLGHVQRARHHHTRAPRGRGGAPRPGRSWSPTARSSSRTPPVDVTRAGGRLPRLLGPQDDGPDRHRGAVGPRRAARRHGALPRRRRHDPRREARLLPAGAAAGPLRGGHAAHRRGGGAHGGHRVPAATSGWTASAPTSWP